MDERLHVGVGHYGIGFKDGVNTVISRNVQALIKIDPDLKITLFGRLSPDHHNFINPISGYIEYQNIEQFDPEVAVRDMGGKSISDQQVHDYIWQGTNIAEILFKRLSDMDIVLVENLSIGIHPALNYAFYLYTRYNYITKEKKKFIYRFHDFAQQRPINFQNIKKFRQNYFESVPDWHTILYPDYPNIRYIVINQNDRWRLVEHGIEEKNIYYLPNPVDLSIIPADDRSKELREKIIQREKLSPDVKFILYPVRCIRRKNIEEAIFLTKFFNSLAEGKTSRKDIRLKGKFHLLVSIKPTEGDDAKYTNQLLEFIKKYNLPVTIGLDDLVFLKREYDPKDPEKIKKYGIGDLYKACDIVITTSFLEGFGFVYTEPWITERLVIGRNIPLVTSDFQIAGMQLEHLYDALFVDKKDFKDIGEEKNDPDRALEERLYKIIKLDNPQYVDKFVENNKSVISRILELFNREKREKLIRKNKKVVEKVYSKEKIGKELYEIIRSD